MPNDNETPPKVVTLGGSEYVAELETVPAQVLKHLGEMHVLLTDPTVRGFAYVAIHEGGELTTASSYHDKYGWALAGGMTRIIHRINNAADELIGK